MYRIPDFNNYSFLSLFALALLVRFAFSFWGSQFYFGEVAYVWKDTGTYFDAFKNWYNGLGYQFDLNYPDSRFFRVPVYPFFIGSFWAMGLYPLGVAVAQILIDLASMYVLYRFLVNLKVAKNLVLFFTAVYATYPFLLVWVPILYTEIIQVFLMVCVIALTFSRFHYKYFVCGVLSALLLLTKQYMAIVVLVPIVYLLFNSNAKRLSLTFVLTGFLLTLSPWVMRNYEVSGDFILLRGDTTGINVVNRDFEAFEKFSNLFTQNVTPQRYQIANLGKLEFENDSAFLTDHREEIAYAARLAHSCGSSFVSLFQGSPTIHSENCNDEVVVAFTELRSKAIEQLSPLELVSTRLQALFKVVIGNTFIDDEYVKIILYAFRAILMLSALLVVTYTFIKYPVTWFKQVSPVFLPALGLIFVFCIVYVHAEIRYLLPVDLLWFVSATLSLSILRRKIDADQR